ncbi:GntR family transcriptional regulator [Wenjunlia vitaminophila]|uniref:GntR family transcriptional regulator n=1 Tax=Wenjunlia vitaminophila TaxID=76728 RepID=A0A0T6LXD3_WENVI|nr:PLP-dependent aminotransferase family protein [Wenjunlia vitaminophila]KRV50740.1 GntR family transcriptional regulator [Wenjunlia vitaminophila]
MTSRVEPAVAAGRLHLHDLHPSLGDPALLSMNFLNEVANRFPDAVSFAPGRPSEAGFDVADLHRYLDRFCDHLARDLHYDDERVRRTLFQYGRTKGVIHHLIARNLAVDEGIEVDPESIVVTVGCQEALFLTLRALRADERDAVLAVSPTYVGLTGAARLLDMPVLPVREDGTGVDLDDLRAKIGTARQAGVRPRALYLVPDFSNPAGVSLSAATRRELLRVAADEGVLLLEDNPYGLFSADGTHPPTLKALDTERGVVYLGSLAKTCFPGARIGFAVADQRVVAADGTESLFADELSKVKSMLTVNTSPVSQAVAAGKLLEHDGSLLRASAREAEIYRKNLARVLDGLRQRFAGVPTVSWNTPAGGFFVVVTVPFAADDTLLEHSARRHGVLWTPMSHFYEGDGGRTQLRLACSSLTPSEIDEGLDRLAALVHERLAVG